MNKKLLRWGKRTVGTALLACLGCPPISAHASEPSAATNLQTNAARSAHAPLASLPLFTDDNRSTNASTQSRSTGQSAANTPIQLSPWITALATDKQGNLWLASEDQGLFRINPTAPTNTPGAVFSSANGLDDHVYAVACDGLGRIWAGTLNRGVFVYNGASWQNYDVVNGPLGERVFQIKVSPIDGDVWMATSRGLARYSLTDDTWSYFTRADGLPSDQIQCVAFDASGRIFVGTQCDGVAIGEASDGYKSWRVVNGPDKLPLTATGEGLPSDLINDILVTRDQTVWVASTTGLASSKDGGYTWQFVRGREWAAKVKGLYGGPPAGWTATGNGVLAEDYVTCLAEDPVSGALWIGHRQRGCGVYNPSTQQYIPMVAKIYSTGFTVLPGGSVLVATYGDGLVDPLSNAPKLYAALSPSPGVKMAQKTSAPLPSRAKSPTTVELQAMLLKAQATPETGVTAAYLGEDWSTQGDCIGRYGRQHTTLCAMQPHIDHTFSWDSSYQVKPQMGPHHATGDVVRTWIQSIVTDDRRALYNPQIGIRRMASWDDHGEGNYPQTQDGPDIWVSVQVRDGVHRISLYFLNDNGQFSRNRYRDYLVELKPPADTVEAAIAQPTLAHTRVKDFWGGVYKQFVVANSGKYWVRIARNNSFNTMCSGVFVDRLAGPKTPQEDKPMPWLGQTRYGPPDPGSGNASVGGSMGKSAVSQLAVQSWAVVDGPCNQCETAGFEAVHRLLAYRAAQADGAPDSLLKNWEWHLRLWSPSARGEFRQTMSQAWRTEQEHTPELRLKKYRPYSPGTVDGPEQ